MTVGGIRVPTVLARGHCRLSGYAVWQPFCDLFMEDWFMRKLLIALIFGGLLAETAVPMIAAAPTPARSDKRPRMRSRHSYRSGRNRRRRNVTRGVVGGAAGGALLGGGRGAAAGAVIGGTAGALTPTHRRHRHRGRR